MKFKKAIRNLMKILTSSPFKTIEDWKKSNLYFQDLKTLTKQKGKDETFPFGNNRPILGEKDVESGNMKGHYFHQDLYIARLIFENKPRKHVDIGSRTDGFVAHVASYREIEIIDIRPQSSKVQNISFKQADLMKLPEGMQNYCDSISSLHAIEHFGLGRYGDPIDYYGHLKALDNIYNMLTQGGIFYFSVPIGPQRIEFNAHRVFSIKHIHELIDEKYSIISFSYVDDQGEFHEDIKLTESMVRENCLCSYGCGIFQLKKI